MYACGCFMAHGEVTFFHEHTDTIQIQNRKHLQHAVTT